MGDEKKQMAEDTGLVFLGLCDRASYVREANTNVFKWNILGLRHVFLTNIFPIDLSYWPIGLAFKPELLGSGVAFRITDESGAQLGTINLAVQSASLEEEDALLTRDGPMVHVSEWGWTTLFLQVTKGVTISRPGEYFFELVTENEPIKIGAIQFVLVDPPPLTPDRIAAIRSDPGASKAVRISLACKICPSKLQCYAGLERSEKSDLESWLWYEDLPDEFACECGSTVIDLQYIRRNLHGLLGHRFIGSGEVSFIPMYEQTALESLRVGFNQLLSEDPREELLQQFIKENPILLHQFPANRILPKPPILNSYIADFGIVNSQKELLLIELEKTTTRLLIKNGGVAAPLNHAFDQVRDWLHEADEHRSAVLDDLDIERNEVSRVRGIVIAGRDGEYDPKALRKLKGADWGQITFLTYDDLLFSLDALIRRMGDL